MMALVGWVIGLATGLAIALLVERHPRRSPRPRVAHELPVPNMPLRRPAPAGGPYRSAPTAPGRAWAPLCDCPLCDPDPSRPPPTAAPGRGRPTLN